MHPEFLQSAMEPLRVAVLHEAVVSRTCMDGSFARRERTRKVRLVAALPKDLDEALKAELSKDRSAMQKPVGARSAAGRGCRPVRARAGWMAGQGEGRREKAWRGLREVMLTEASSARPRGP